MSDPFKSWPTSAKWVMGALLTLAGLAFARGEVFGANSEKLDRAVGDAAKAAEGQAADHEIIVRIDERVKALVDRDLATERVLKQIELLRAEIKAK